MATPPATVGLLASRGLDVLLWATAAWPRDQQKVPAPLTAEHTAALLALYYTAGALLVMYGIKLLLGAKQGPLQLLLGFAGKRPKTVSFSAVGAANCPILDPASTLGFSIGGMKNSNTEHGHRRALSFGLKISKAAEDMLRSSIAGGMQLLSPLLAQPYGRQSMDSWNGLNVTAALSAAPSGWLRAGALEQAAADVLSRQGRRASTQHAASLRRRPSSRLSQRISLDFSLNTDPTSMQAYSEVPGHKGQMLVLYVDKSPIDQAVMAMLLGSEGQKTFDFKIVSAGCGREALDLVFSSTYLPDLVLVDTMLPDMNASEVCRILRARFSPIELPIVLVTGRSGESDALAALDKGVNDFILKPLRQLELLARINSQLMVKQSIKREAESRSHYDLLAQVLPPHIIARLAQGQAYTPEQHEQVTILFSDIVGFTEICSKWSTYEVVNMLDLMFSRFDELCDKHDVFKVETIGDAYMVASGHEGCADHALRMTAMAVDMLDAVKGLEQELGTAIRVRIGMHTGPALSGVVGKRRPRYCFFGDTVNTASRMESTGHPMTIHISEACKQSMVSVAATGSSAVGASASGTLIQRRPAPLTVPQDSMLHNLSEFFMSTSSNKQTAVKSRSPPTSPGHSPKTFPSSRLNSNSSNSLCSRDSSPAGSQRSSTERPIKSGLPQDSGGNTDGSVRVTRLRRNSSMVPAIAALSAIAVVTTTSKATNSQMHSIHSRSVDSLSVMAATAICCQEADVDSSPDAQEAADDMLLMSDEEEHPGLPWKLLDLGYAHVKGKGFMKTYLLQVGEWQKALVTVRARHAAEVGKAADPAWGTGAGGNKLQPNR